MFRRGSRDGSLQRYDIGGIWGGGNVVVERDARLAMNPEATVFTLWDGHAIAGEGRPGSLERYPALVAVLETSEFLERYRSLGAACEVWLGDEVVGQGCDAACADLDTRCPSLAVADCQRACEGWPRAIADCMASRDSCEGLQECNFQLWQQEFADGQGT